MQRWELLPGAQAFHCQMIRLALIAQHGAASPLDCGPLKGRECMPYTSRSPVPSASQTQHMVSTDESEGPGANLSEFKYSLHHYSLYDPGLETAPL